MRRKFDKLLSKKNVIGYSDEGDKVEVYVTKKYDDSTAKRLINTESVDFSEEDLVPKKLRKWFKQKDTDVIEIGPVETQVDRKKYRPLKGGCQIGIKDNQYYGTGGGVVYRRSYGGLKLYGRWENFYNLLKRYGISVNEEKFLLTNTHVALPHVENWTPEEYEQPYAGEYIGKNCEAAYFSRHKPNKIDAAIIPLEEDILDEIVPGWWIKGFNYSVNKGDSLKKYGARTEETHGEVLRKDISVNINHRGQEYFFRDVIMADDMSDGGDSGSMVLDEDDNVIGIIFAGNDQYSFIIPIERIVKKFKLSTQY